MVVFRKSLLAVSLVAASGLSVGADFEGSPTGVLAAPGGRFVFGQISAARRDQFMLDTQTGRLWQIVCTEVDKTNSSRCNGATVLEPITFTQPGMPLSFTPQVPFALKPQ